MKLTLAVTALLGAATLGAAAEVDAILAKPILGQNVPTVEVQVFSATRVAPWSPASTAAEWQRAADALRRRVLDDVILRGEAKRWQAARTRTEWLDGTIEGDGYRIRKLRFEAIPGFWIPALLYEPAKVTGRVPVVLNVNGHEKTGKFTGYIQERCINLAKRGIPALNPEWIGRGQMNAPSLSHYRLNQLDLCGTSGIAVFYLSLKRSLDLLLSLPYADPERVAVTGLSGGGWQTIFISSLDTRVRLANPVAGYSSFVTRTQFPALDLGDPEQTPSDLAAVADYTHLTALMAPRPTLLTYNALDTCCFRADNSLAPLVNAARPVFQLYGKADKFRHHVNFDPGHNYGPDNREAFYRMLRDHFFGGREDFAVAEIPVTGELRTAEQLEVPLPSDNLDFHALAVRLSAALPRSGQPGRERLQQVVHAPRYQVNAERVEMASEGGFEVARWRLRMDNDWTVPVVEISPPNARSTVLVVADEGRVSLGAQIGELLAGGRRVVAIDPFYFGESRLPKFAGLFAILVASVGERPLGIQAGQVAAAARWLHSDRGIGPVTVVSAGPRSSLFALVAAALEPQAIAALEQRGAMSTLKEVITQDLTVDRRPEQFCFGLLEEFDIPQMSALVSPRPIRRW